MGFDNRTFAAAIIELGVNGHIKLRETSKDNTQVQRRQGGKPIGRAEQAMENKLFGSDNSLLLTQTNHERISKARDTLQENLTASYSSYFSTNFGWSILGWLLAIVAVVALAIAIGSTYGSDHSAGAIVGMLIPVIPAMIAAALLRKGLDSLGRNIAALVTVVIGAVVGIGFLYLNTRGVIEMLPGLAPSALAALAFLGSGWLRAPSVEGRKVMDHIDGFREYLSVAEEERLEYLNPPEKTPELFERFLPYAIALDVENTWATRFAGVLAAAAAAGTAGAAYGVSNWYSGSGDMTRDPVSFVDRIGSDLSSTIASAATAPGSSSGSDSGGSSGSGGGGSSGGGGGGGGGSGW
jgi:uncharacterized membrane protein YgcG